MKRQRKKKSFSIFSSVEEDFVKIRPMWFFSKKKRFILRRFRRFINIKKWSKMIYFGRNMLYIRLSNNITCSRNYCTPFAQSTWLSHRIYCSPNKIIVLWIFRVVFFFFLNLILTPRASIILVRSLLVANFFLLNCITFYVKFSTVFTFSSHSTSFVYLFKGIARCSFQNKAGGIAANRKCDQNKNWLNHCGRGCLTFPFDRRCYFRQFLCYIQYLLRKWIFARIVPMNLP